MSDTKDVHPARRCIYYDAVSEHYLARQAVRSGEWVRDSVVVANTTAESPAGYRAGPYTHSLTHTHPPHGYVKPPPPPPFTRHCFKGRRLLSPPMSDRVWSTWWYHTCSTVKRLLSRANE